MKNLFIFDMDQTLMRSDAVIDKEHAYMTLDHQKPIRRMMFLFNFLKKINRDVMIMTNRHPNLEKEIQEKFGIWDVKCRGYCLDKWGVEQALHNKEALEVFMFNMVVEKSVKINELSENFDRVYFFDDMLDSEWDLNDNVVPIKSPISIFGVIKFLFKLIF